MGHAVGKRGLVTSMRGSLGLEVNQNAKCYRAPWQGAILSPPCTGHHLTQETEIIRATE